MGTEFLASVEKWLEKSGHAFELRVARAFREAGADTVDLAFAYTDPSTGTVREGDVLAQYDWTARNNIPASVEVVIECKSGRDHPWVAFYDREDAGEAGLDDWVYFAHGPFVGVTEPLTEAWVGQAPFDARRVASHLVAAHEKDSHNPAGDAVRQVLSAAAARQERYIERQGQGGRGCVIVSVVVTAARLVTCDLAADGSTRLEEVSSVVVSAPRRGDKAARVFVINDSHAGRFAKTILDLTTRARKRALSPE